MKSPAVTFHFTFAICVTSSLQLSGFVLHLPL
jgi:hypothetical protein